MFFHILLEYLNEDKENNKIDTSDAICQTLEANQEKITEVQKKPDGINIKGTIKVFLNLKMI